MTAIAAKICGITTPEAMIAARTARFIGLVFYPRSPRSVSPMLAAELARQAATTNRIVGLFVNPDNDWLEHIMTQVPLDMIQLHGQEPPARVADIRSQFNLPVIKAIGISARDDLATIAGYEAVADWLLFDAKPPANVAALPGGNGLAFDWQIMRDLKSRKPWMLSGGLTPANVATAIEITGAKAVDVSSGVEERPGLKDPALIADFLAACSDAQTA